MAEITNNVKNSQDDNVDFLPLLQDCYRVFVYHWKWFALSVVVCVGLATLYLMRQPLVYQLDAVMMVEDDMGQGRRRGNNNLNALMELNGVAVGDNLQNEIYILQSLRLMKVMVERLNLSVAYTTSEGLRNVAVYNNKPFEVVFSDPFSVPVDFKVEIVAGDQVRLSHFRVDNETVAFDEKVSFGQRIKTPAGTIVVKKQPKYLADFIGKSIQVNRQSVEQTAMEYRKKVSAREVDKESSLINLTCQDIDVQRAEDILSTLLAVYKEDIVESKNRIAASTQHFVDERISLIGKDLSQVESRLAKFKEKNSIVDFDKNAQVFLSERTSARQRSLTDRKSVV